MKHIQITEELFLMLCNYFLNNDTAQHESIKNELDKKLDKMVLRQIYSEYKGTESDTERAKLKSEYIDYKQNKGV